MAEVTLGKFHPLSFTGPTASAPVSWKVTFGLLPLIIQPSCGEKSRPWGEARCRCSGWQPQLCAPDQHSTPTASQVSEPSGLSNLVEQLDDCSPSWPTAAIASETPSKNCWSEPSQPTNSQKIIITCCLRVACYIAIKNWNKEALNKELDLTM